MATWAVSTVKNEPSNTLKAKRAIRPIRNKKAEATLLLLCFRYRRSLPPTPSEGAVFEFLENCVVGNDLDRQSLCVCPACCGMIGDAPSQVNEPSPRAKSTRTYCFV